MPHPTDMPGFLWGAADTCGLTEDEIRTIRGIFAQCYGGKPEQWSYLKDRSGAGIVPVGGPPPRALHTGYRLKEWVSDTVLALHTLPEARALTFDDEVLAAYACGNQPLALERTSYRELRRLSPRHGLELDQSGRWVEAAYRVPEEPTIERRFSNIEVAAEALRAALNDALAQIAREHAARTREVTPTSPVVVELSGGLDSTLIAALARNHFSNVQCITITNPSDPNHYDGVWADTAAAILELTHHTYTLADLRAWDKRAAGHSPEPRLARGWDHSRGQLLAAHTSLGASLVLTGHGSDSLFALTPQERLRQQQHGMLAWTRALAGMAWQRRGLPSLQWRKRLYVERRRTDVQFTLSPWYERTLEPSLNEMLDQRSALSLTTNWESYWTSPFFRWAESYTHPGATGIPVWQAHPFLSLNVVKLSRQFPAWPLFDQKAVVRRALIQEGLHQHAARPKQTTDIALPFHSAIGAAAFDDWANLVDEYRETLPDIPHLWADTKALTHALTHWQTYPRATQHALQVTLGTLEWTKNVRSNY